MYHKHDNCCHSSIAMSPNGLFRSALQEFFNHTIYFVRMAMFGCICFQYLLLALETVINLCKDLCNLQRISSVQFQLSFIYFKIPQPTKTQTKHT